jgi:glycyl-tRNA synthetase alpha chain
MGGIDLAPVSCEITYGLERIAMFLQGVDNVFDLEWGAGVSYADVRLREEVEASRYVFGQVEGLSAEDFSARHRELFDRNYELAEILLDSRLVLPALEHCLKCSHLFNILDSSGSVGVTERTAYILRVRKLAVRIAKLYVEQLEAGETAGEPAGAAVDEGR